MANYSEFSHYIGGFSIAMLVITRGYLQVLDVWKCFFCQAQQQVMKNDKTVDPRDKKSTKVIQLETAMGAAISCFEGQKFWLYRYRML